MARKNNETKKSTFKEFTYSNGANNASGRIYPDNVRNTEKAERYPLLLTINGLAIVGAYLVLTDNNTFITFPQYKAKDGNYKSIVYMYEKEDIAFLADLAKEIEKAI